MVVRDLDNDMGPVKGLETLSWRNWLGKTHIHQIIPLPDTDCRERANVLPWAGYNDFDFTMQSDAESKRDISLSYWPQNSGSSVTLVVQAEPKCHKKEPKCHKKP